jgi:heptaprenyl diphosphate synthase
MQYPSKQGTSSSTRRIAFIGLFISIALVLSYFERFIPISFTFPGVRLGLANIITLVVLYIYGFRDALSVVVIRVTLNALFVGSVLSFWFSLAGGLLSLVFMLVAMKLFNDRISVIGVSVIGALFHNIGQLIVIAIVTRSVDVALSYFPVLAISAVITGVFTGLCVKLVKKHLANIL